MIPCLLIPPESTGKFNPLGRPVYEFRTYPKGCYPREGQVKSNPDGRQRGEDSTGMEYPKMPTSLFCGKVSIKKVDGGRTP